MTLASNSTAASRSPSGALVPLLGSGPLRYRVDFGAPCPGLILVGPCAEGRMSKSKISVGR